MLAARGTASLPDVIRELPDQIETYNVQVKNFDQDTRITGLTRIIH
jgi:hypothetical protein